jgi:hypothetical protein
MTFEEQTIEGAKLGMILDAALAGRSYCLIYQRENGQAGVATAGTSRDALIQNLRRLADAIEQDGAAIQFHGTREYPGSDEL